MDTPYRAANSFEVLAREWFAKHVANWSDSHTKRTGRFLEGDLFPWLGAQPIATSRPTKS